MLPEIDDPKIIASRRPPTLSALDVAVDIEGVRQRKDPRFHPKKTKAVTERVVRLWARRSDAYLWSAEQAQSEIFRLCRQFGGTDECPPWGLWDVDGEVVEAVEVVQPYATVCYDGLEYGLELTLKAAQLIDGYHELNRGMGFPQNFEAGGLTYVYLKPTHRLDLIYEECLSDTMKQALERFLPMRSWIETLYRILHPDSDDINWAPGTDHRVEAGRVRYDSVRYNSDWISRWVPTDFVKDIIAGLRPLNRRIPFWFNDRTLTP